MESKGMHPGWIRNDSFRLFLSTAPDLTTKKSGSVEVPRGFEVGQTNDPAPSFLRLLRLREQLDRPEVVEVQSVDSCPVGGNDGEVFQNAFAGGARQYPVADVVGKG